MGFEKRVFDPLVAAIQKKSRIENQSGKSLFYPQNWGERLWIHQVDAQAIRQVF
jgi:hypothetical protein